MDYQNLRFLQDTFIKTAKISSWTLTGDGQLVYSNCPEQDLYYSLFALSGCSTYISEHFAKADTPVLASDEIGFVWIAACQKPEETHGSRLVHLLGPVFISEMTETHLRRRLRRLRVTPDFEDRFLRIVRDVPTVLTNTASSYAGMLHYCLNGEAIKSEDIVIRNTPSEDTEEVIWGDTRWHGTWISEQRFFKSVTEGRYDGIRELSVGRIGDIGGGDPLRQAKNELLVFSVLCSRAAIFGGVSSEGALNLEDFFVQTIEAAQTVPEVQRIGMDMHRAFIDRVRIAQAGQDRSSLVRSCVEYVETHILDRIRVKDIADSAGYTENYISRCFKAEMGCSLSEYINRRKIETAMLIMSDNAAVSLAELSDHLSFSNPSYFTSVFRKITGQTPGRYLEKRAAESSDRNK